MKGLNTNYLPQSPCKDCVPPTRHEGCHSSCQLFLDYEKAATEARNKAKEKRSVYSEYLGYKRDHKSRQKR